MGIFHRFLFSILFTSIAQSLDFLVTLPYPTANLNTTWNTDYVDYQPMLHRKTNVSEFVCGFYCPTSPCTSFIFAVSTYPDGYAIWSANRDHMVSENATLNFTSAGELVLTDVDGSIVWTTNTVGKSVAGMNLTDTGNLVLFDVNNSVIWQSFDHPTNCLLPGQKLFTGQHLKSSVSSDNSSEGMYSLQVTDTGYLVYLESNPPQIYNSWLMDVNDTNYKGRRYIMFLNGSLSFSIDSSDQEEDDFVVLIGMPPALSAQYMQLMPNGHLQVFEWQSIFKIWAVATDVFNDHGIEDCGYPLVCRRNSICSTDQQCICPTLDYFRPVNELQLNQGCYEITPLACNSTQNQDFITLENVTYFIPLAHSDMKGVNMETCKQACINNCSCKAAYFMYDSNVSSGFCQLPSEIFTMTPSLSVNTTSLAFIKVQNATSPPLSPQVKNVTSPPSSHQVGRVVGSAIGSFVFVLVVAIGFIMYIVHKRKKDAEIDEDYLDQLPGMPTRFFFEELKTATEKFSKKLGQGGFGSVFEGNLKDGSIIAVKCLEGLSHVKKSFLAEVQSIGNIHRVNLVRLRGFCTWKSQRFLVYEFMSNGSLDKWIYHGRREHVLEWKCRKQIILDIAKGLAYLHEDCRQKIVHLDIKPQNILLDNDFNANVSDFGLSKLIDKNQTQVMSTINGTPGYIAPEWQSSIVTEKLDVYSFGIVLLEIISGRKIFDRSKPEESWHLLSVFQKCWEQGTLLDMVDRYSEDMQVHNNEVMEMMKLASWCLQTNYKRRPSMSSVVTVLEGGMKVESNLNYNFTDPRIQETTVREEKDLTQLSPFLLSGPR